MTKLLREMYLNLSDSLKKDVTANVRVQNYQKQLLFYRRMYDQTPDKTQKENMLVAARCLISISRNLCENEHTAKSLDFAREQLHSIRGVFESERASTREEIRQITNRRIALLSQNNCDELADAFLFLYMSLLQL